jgi:hypothetical protein
MKPAVLLFGGLVNAAELGRKFTDAAFNPVIYTAMDQETDPL